MASDMMLGDGASQEEEADTPAGSSESPYDRTDSEGTCDGWKFAYCDAIAACSAFSTREQCEAELVHVDCHEDAPFESCAAQIDNAVENDQCDSLPSECTPANIADRRVPTQLCQDIHEAQCEFQLFCGLSFNLESCLVDAARREPCEEFVAALPQASECADAIAISACDAPAPDSCINVLIR